MTRTVIISWDSVKFVKPEQQWVSVFRKTHLKYLFLKLILFLKKHLMFFWFEWQIVKLKVYKKTSLTRQVIIFEVFSGYLFIIIDPMYICFSYSQPVRWLSLPQRISWVTVTGPVTTRWAEVKIFSESYYFFLIRPPGEEGKRLKMPYRLVLV